MVARFEPQTNKKFFDPAIFQKCWRGVGEQPTFAKQIKLHETSQQKSKRKSEKSQLPSKSEDCNMKQGFRGNCDSLGKLGMCPSLAEPYAIGFPKSIISVATVPPEQLQDCCLRLIIENLALRKTKYIWFGKIALLFAFVLFAGDCHSRMIFQSLLDFSLLEVPMFLKQRTAICFS